MSQSREELMADLTQLAYQIRQSEREIGVLSRDLASLTSQADAIRAEIAREKTKLERAQTLLDITVAQLAKLNAEGA